MNKKYHFFIIICIFSLMSFPYNAKASDMNTANSMIEDMKKTRVKVFGSKCGHDWKNKYDFVSKRAKIMFVGQVISLEKLFKGRSKIRYRILIPINGISPDQEFIDVYTPISFKEKGKIKSAPLPEKHGIRIVMAYKHTAVFNEFKFSYCEEETVGKEKSKSN